jgi:AmiR/NasT family two-component response regulator
LPRWSCTIVEPRVARILDRLGFERSELADAARPERRIAEQALPASARAVIEQAKGVLMAQRHVDAEQAFEILRAASQRYNRKLRDIALGIVQSTQEERPN